MRKPLKIRIRSIAIAAILVMIAILSGCSSQPKDQKIPVQVLLLPKFELDAIIGDFPGEAQYFYEAYLDGGDSYAIDGWPDTHELYYKNGVAMCLLGQGKINAALTISAILLDERFDFSDAYILCVGCGGAAAGYGIFGDVFVISTAVDFDLGYWADARELGDKEGTAWFHDETLDDSAVVPLDTSLTDRVFELVKNVQLETTENTVNYLKREFSGEAWADRPPQVMRGTSVTSDQYWKGIYDHQNALLITETYHCKDPYAITEMEDIAVARAAQFHGFLDRLIILRVAVNMDVFPTGVTPEMLWGPESDEHITSENGLESVDIFATAMKNNFATGSMIIDAILEGTLEDDQNGIQ